MARSGRGRGALAVLLAVLSAAPTFAFTVSASAAAPNTFSPPVWFPLRGDHLIGCGFKSCDGGTYHPYWAIDIKGAKGETAYAAGAGRVVNVVTNQGGNCDVGRFRTTDRCPNGSKGNSVTIDHGGGVFSYYQHFQSVSVVKDQPVDQNTPIGKVGDSGLSTPGFYHLHFERRSGSATGTRVDPGPLKGCVGSALKAFPKDLAPAPGYSTWQGIPTERFTAHSDGTACGTRGGGGGGGGGKPKVDVVFVIDTTGSMGPYIGAAKAAASGIATALFATADARVALVDYKDLYQSCASDGYAARVDLPFSTSAAAFSSALAPLSASGGCDFPESVYSGLMAGIELPWRNGVTKALILLGDAPPHDPEPVTGFTRAQVSAAARAVDPAAIYSINIGSAGSPFFEDLAADTGGTSYPVSDPASAVEKIGEAITTITDSGVTADLGGPYVGTVGEPVTFDATSSVPPADANIVTYEWDYDGDDAYDETTPVGTVSHAYGAPYNGVVGLRVTTDQTPAQSVATTADVTVFSPTRLKYTGQRAGNAGETVHVQTFVTVGEDVPAAGMPVTMSVGTAACTATTDADGKAVCDVVLPATGSATTVEANAVATYPYFGGSTSEQFNLH